MDITRASDGQDSASHATENRIVAKERIGSQEKIDKQSINYVLRSGLAGGLAGCAVSPSPSSAFKTSSLSFTSIPNAHT